MTAHKHAVSLIPVSRDDGLDALPTRAQDLIPILLAPLSVGVVHKLQPARARSMCGRELDWIEVVR
jgi:hypothetical protein